MPLFVGIAVLAVAGGGVALYLRGTTPTRSAASQVDLERAVAVVDRELAADLELMSMFDQTKQAFVLENAGFLATRHVIEREAADAYDLVADVYERIPATERSMERRGPAGSIPDADRAVVHEWEGDAREAQRLLRAAAAPTTRTRWERLTEGLRRR
ncbi:MAG: hypothetical protein KGJ98_06260 [Chloroflexota bacterium]|nr:hypothetical protein [Chloroflexota bacterium]MDE3101825.1 hypothetical protein [Chloroflexota bacterium]